MKKRILAAAAAVVILCGLLGGCVHADDGQNKSAQALSEIRAESFTDIANNSPDYDVACYMLYYGLMDTVDGAFYPNDMISYIQATDVFCRLSGQTAQEGQADQDGFLTRAQLAVLLYEAAKHLGYPTEIDGGDPNPSATEQKYAADLAQADPGWSTAVHWALEMGLFRNFVGAELLPNTAVSRMQVAQAIVGLKTLGKDDAVAAEIWQALPVRTVESAAVKNHDAIQAAVDAAAKKYGAAGVQVAVIENGVVTDTYAYGWATKDTDPMTTDHKIRIASITKVIIGITAQLLREEKIVDFDQDISQYWGVTVQNPQYPNIPITIRSMLTHCSTIINASTETSRAYNDVKSKLQGSVAGGYGVGVPGDIGYWSYNNYAYGVLGMTLELAAQQTCDGILTDRLYTAMDIDAAFGPGDLKNTDLLVTLYRYDGTVGRTVQMQKEMHSDPLPGANGAFFSGDVVISVKDLAKVIALLAADGSYEGVQLMQPESIAEMQTYVEQAVPDGSYQAHPMRYWPNLYGRQGIYFHTGSAYGVFNAATYDPVTGDGVVVLTTGASGAKDEYGIYKICAAINETIYEVIQ